MAIWISMAAIGARMTISRAAIGLPPSSSSPMGTKMARWATQVMTAPMVAATEEMRMSRFCTCDSSWASTPSSSRRSRMGRMPWVTATAAASGVRAGGEALCHRDGGVLGVAAGGEGVGLRAGRDVQARHGDGGLVGQALDDLVELGELGL